MVKDRFGYSCFLFLYSEKFLKKNCASISMHQKFIIGVDIGTTNCKGVIIDTEGSVRAEAQIEHNVIYPQVGWAEHNPEENWWKTFVLVIKKLVSQGKVPSQKLAAIGVTGLGPNLIPIGKNGKPLRNAILYSDTRSVKEIHYLKENYGKEIFELSGNQVTTQTVAPKILWFRNNERENFKETEKILFGSYNYIVYRLTKNFAIDYGTAKWTGLFDGKKLTWDQKICEGLGIPLELLPQTCYATDIVGTVSNDTAQEIGIPPGTPVIAGALDSATETLSAGVMEPGEAIIIYGTTTILKVVIQDFLKDPRLHSDIHCIKPLKYFLGGAMTTTGATVRWFRDNLYKEEKQTCKTAYQILDEEASKIPFSGLIVLPYFMGERTPIFDPLARGVIFGLTLSHTRSHIYKAILEATGYAVAQHIEILRENGINVTKLIAAGGGAKSTIWRQIVSDITNVEQEYCDTLGAPFGVAFLAGYGVGLFDDFQKIKEWIKVKEKNIPNIERHNKYNKYYNLYKNLYNVLKGSFKELYLCNQETS